MKTKVIFKKITWDLDQRDEQTTIEAIFTELEENQFCLVGYTKIGQHSPISKVFLNNGRQGEHLVKDATKEEYLSLYNELVSLGYDLEVV